MVARRAAAAPPGRGGLRSLAEQRTRTAWLFLAPLLIAPAMNGKMWQHAATQQNVGTLKSRGAQFIGPEEGLLACGYEGLGRLWSVDAIAARAMEIAQKK